MRPLAVIIGIAEYAQPRWRLTSPVHDAEALAALLEQSHGYEVWLRRDGEATRAALVRLFDEELPAAASEARPLLVYFAGHGMAVDSVEEPAGYLVPADGGVELESLLPMAELHRALGKLPCRHLVLLLDCCFAGAFRWSSGRDMVAAAPPQMYRERYQRFLSTPAWQVITSAAYDEKAADVVAGMAVGRREGDGTQHSPFLAALLAGLGGAADRYPDRGDGVITASELYLYLYHALETQTPGLWLLPRHKKGEYIFEVPGAEVRLPAAPELARETSPYRGFEVYEEQHADRFFGRRAATAALLARVEERAITVVVGASGTGKSSLVRAGLVPALRRAHPEWQILPPMRPGTAAVAALDEVLAGKRDGTAVLVVDQLEEVFGGGEGAALLGRLAARVAAGDLRVVGTLRSDLETELWSSPLASTWEQVRFPLADMNRDELREAIELPAERMVLTFVPPEMVDRLINTVVSMPGALPLLSFTLDKLYLDCVTRAAGDRELREVDQADVGGIALALRTHADALHAGLDEPARDTLRRILLRLVTLKGGAVARRQVPIAELQFADAAENARVAQVIDALTDPKGLRLAVRGGDQHGGYIELAHDAVTRDWPQFRQWLREARQEDLLLHRTVAGEAAEWAAGGRHDGLLWRDDPRLSVALDRLAATPHLLNRDEHAFLIASRRARRRRTQVIAGAVAAFVATVSVLAVIATLQWRSAERRREEAVAARSATELERKRERAGRLALDARRFLGSDPRRSLLIAAEAMPLVEPTSPRVERTMRDALAAVHGRVLVAGDPGVTIEGVAVNRAGDRIASGDSLGVIQVWQAGSEAPPRRLILPDPSGFRLLGFTADGSHLLAASYPRLRMWNLDAPSAAPSAWSVGSVMLPALSGDGALVAALDAGHDGVHVIDLRQVDIASDTSVKWPHAPLREVPMVSPSGAWIAVVDDGVPVLDHPDEVHTPDTAPEPDDRGRRVGLLQTATSGFVHIATTGELARAVDQARGSGERPKGAADLFVLGVSDDGRLVVSANRRLAMVWWDPGGKLRALPIDLDIGSRPALVWDDRGERSAYVTTSRGVCRVRITDPPPALPDDDPAPNLAAQICPPGVTNPISPCFDPSSPVGNPRGPIIMCSLGERDPLRARHGWMLTTTRARPLDAWVPCAPQDCAPADRGGPIAEVGVTDADVDERGQVLVATDGRTVFVREVDAAIPFDDAGPIATASGEVSADGRWLAAAGALRFLDGRHRRQVGGGLPVAGPVTFTADGRWALAGGQPGVAVWSIALDPASPGWRQVAESAIAVDAAAGAIARHDAAAGAIVITDAAGAERRRVAAAALPATVAFDPSGRWLVYGDGGDVVHVSGVTAAAVAEHRCGTLTRAPEMSPLGRWMMLHGQLGGCLVELGGNGAAQVKAGTRVSAWSPDERWAVLDEPGDGPALWNLAAAPARVLALRSNAAVRVAQFDASSQRLLIGGGDKAWLYRRSGAGWSAVELELGEDLGPIAAEPGPRHAAFSPDGRWLAVAGLTLAQLWDLERADARPTRVVGRNYTWVTFRPDSRQLIGVSGEEVAAWDLAALDQSIERAVLAPRSGAIRFSPDGERLILTREVGNDRVSIWPIGRAALLTQAEVHAGRNLSLEDWSESFGVAPYHRTFASYPEHPSRIHERIRTGTALVRTGDVAQARAAFADASRWAVEHGDPWLLVPVCECGNQADAAAAVAEACRLADALVPAPATGFRPGSQSCDDIGKL